MSGFSGSCCFSKNPINIEWPSSNIYKNQGAHSSEHLNIKYASNQKFAADKLFEKSENSVCGIDGVILNKQHLVNSHATPWNTLFEQKADQNLSSFLNELRGEFNGFFFDKHRNELFLFVCQNGTKPIYYASLREQIIFSPNYLQLVQVIKNHFSLTLDLSSVDECLKSGYVREEKTHFNEIKRLKGGAFLKFDGKVFVQKYWDWNAPTYNSESIERNAKQLNNLFENAIHDEYQKDIEYGYQHCCTLSGGLDSRMNVLYAQKLNYHNKTHFCTSQSGYLDIKIAREIAADLNEEVLFHALDNCTHLKDIASVVKINGGLVSYSGAGHMLEMYRKILPDNAGIIHSGQLGDGLLNSFVPKTGQENVSASGYKNSEIDAIYNKTFNSVNNGSWTTEPFSYLVSPFMHFDVLNFILTIPPDQRRVGRLYFYWIKNHLPQAAKYKWENINLKPSEANQKRGLFLNKFRLGLMNKLYGHNLNRSMNPYDYWIKNDKELSALYNKVFQDNLGLLDADLRLMVLKYYETNKVTTRINCLTFLTLNRLVSEY